MIVTADFYNNFEDCAAIKNPVNVSLGGNRDTFSIKTVFTRLVLPNFNFSGESHFSQAYVSPIEYNDEYMGYGEILFNLGDMGYGETLSNLGDMGYLPDDWMIVYADKPHIFYPNVESSKEMDIDGRHVHCSAVNYFGIYGQTGVPEYECFLNNDEDSRIYDIGMFSPSQSSTSNKITGGNKALVLEALGGVYNFDNCTNINGDGTIYGSYAIPNIIFVNHFQRYLPIAVKKVMYMDAGDVEETFIVDGVQLITQKKVGGVCQLVSVTRSVK